GGREGEGHLHDEVVTSPLVRRRGLDPCDDDQVAARATVLANLALPLEPDLRAVLDARLDLHGERAPPPLAAGAVALRARLLDHGAVASTARARLRQGKQTLRLGDDTATIALRADDRSRAGLCAGAAALRAGDGQLYRDLRLGAVQGVLERETHLGLDVRAAHRLRARAASAAAVAEDVPEDVAEVPEIAEVDVDAAGARPRSAAPVRRAVAVVCLPLLCVGEDVVRRLHLLEAL